jgi:hypothetical protein
MAAVLAVLITRNIAGTTITASRRTIWHLRWTIFKLFLYFPKARLRIIQGTCSHGIYSAGTHDFDCVLDVEIIGMPGATDEARWFRAQRFLRNHGWAAWFRHTGTWAARSAWHIHMISIPPGLPANPTPEQIGRAFAKIGLKVGEYIDGGWTTKGAIVATAQLDDFFRHTFGLKGEHASGADGSWFPANILAQVFRQEWWPNRYRGV